MHVLSFEASSEIYSIVVVPPNFAPLSPQIEIMLFQILCKQYNINQLFILLTLLLFVLQRHQNFITSIKWLLWEKWCRHIETWQEEVILLTVMNNPQWQKVNLFKSDFMSKCKIILVIGVVSHQYVRTFYLWKHNDLSISQTYPVLLMLRW